MLIVAHFSTSTSGGAAIAARRLHESLSGVGVKSLFYHSRNAPGQPNLGYRVFETDDPSTRLGQLLLRVNRRRFDARQRTYLEGRPAGLELFSSARLPVNTPVAWNEERLAVIHLHWISSLIDYPSFFSSIPPEFPIVWTLHDMNPLTGGCHYSGGCEAFKSECKHCPQLRNPSATDLSNQEFRVKRLALAGRNLHVVADSMWLEERARDSRLFRSCRSIRTIHYGLDTTAYRPKDKGLCKRALGIAPDAFVVCVGAEQIANKRKGLSIAFEALERIRNRTNVVCLQFGGGEELPKRGGLQCKALGFIQSSEIQSLVYSAADVFLLPSLEEAFGQVGIEAMACGTPVIAFNVGGIPEFIRPRTGLLAKLGDAGDLADKIDWMVENSAERLSMGEAGRAVVENEYTLERQADAYRKLYEEVSRCG